MEYFTGSPEDAEPTAEELGLKSPIVKQVYGLSKKVRELQATADRRLELLKVYDEQRIHEGHDCHFCDSWRHTPDCELAKELSNES